MLTGDIAVFRDVATPRPLPTTGVHSPGRSHHQHFEHSQMQQVGQGSTRTEYAGFTFNGSNFSTGDLGQFWLWNMEPYVDDSGASWQSGEDHNQEGF